MSASTKAAALAAMWAHFKAEAEEILGEITPVADAAAPIVSTVLALAGQPAAAAGVTAGDKLLDTANTVAQHGVSASTIPGLINDVEAEVKKL